MPLLKGKSKKAFSHNVATEMEHGHPQKQSLAIAYSMRKKHAADGGEMCAHGGPGHCAMGCYAEGGYTGAAVGSKEKGVHQSPAWQPDKGKSYAGTQHRSAMTSHSPEEKAFQKKEVMDAHERVLGEMRSMPNPKLMAKGGMLTDDGYQSSEDGLDMIGRIIARHMSKGGMVANDTPITAGFKPNDFDDLALRDDLESTYTGANSGDEDGSELNQDEDDLISRVMRKRKQRNPVPA